jgi:ribosomal protein S18 acetylase RimI-like enzyme
MGGKDVVEVRMVRELTDEGHNLELPEGYSLRWYRDGDRDAWQRIQRSTGIYEPLAPDLFDREFGEHRDLLPARQCFVEVAPGVPVGTATAWLGSLDNPYQQGRLHWVAVSPAHQRKGIGSYLTETACSRLREMGAGSVYLTTGSDNVGAVQLYLGLGFRPEVAGEVERLAWRSLVDPAEKGENPRWREKRQRP